MHGDGGLRAGVVKHKLLTYLAAWVVMMAKSSVRR
jgi:hypothetical protein